jgi:ubiquinone/menaquinone biosynthesis C-methylase UbiE
MPDESGKYIHGSDPSEQQRLSLLNDLMNESSLQAMRLAGGEFVLDVGCGLGQLTSHIAQTVTGNGRVIGIERDEAQFAEAQRLAGAESPVEFRRGEAVDMPLGDDEWGAFDVVHARFLLEHVPEPPAVVDAMLRAAKAGGRIILEDDDHDVLRLWPEPAGVMDIWRAYIEAYRKNGNDPFIGRRLVELLYSAGAVTVTNRWNFFGSCAGQDSFAGFVDNFAGVIESARESLTSLTAVTADDIDAALAALREWGARRDAALWYCTFWAEGYKAL